MWFQVELPQPVMIAGDPVRLRSPADAAAGPAVVAPAQPGAGPAVAVAARARRHSAASRSGTGCRSRWTARTWGAPVAEGAGALTPTIVAMRPVQAKFIRVTQTATGETRRPWSVLNFRVYVQ